MFSIKYSHPEYPGEIWAADWDSGSGRIWSISYSPEDQIHYEAEERMDGWAYEAILSKFGLLEWKEEYPLIIILMMSPAELAQERRRKEKEHGLSRLEIISDNIHVVAGKGQILHYAEDYE